MANTYIRVSLAGGGSDDRRLKVSGDDSTAAFLDEKVSTGSSRITKNVLNPGGNELLELDVDQSAIDHDQLLNFDPDEHAPLNDAATATTSLWSSQQISDYVAAQIATKDEAIEISYDNSTSGITATNVQDALDEIEGRLDTAEGDVSANTASINNHITDISGAHAASAISYDNTISSLTATDVKEALDELQSTKFDSADFSSEFDSNLASKSTTDLSEGANLYYTDERSQDSVGTILADTASINLTYDDVTPQISAEVLPAGVDHDALQNYVALEHVDHSNVEISTGVDSGLTGGGDISTTRNLSVDINGTTLESIIADDDEILIYDTSAGALRRMTRGDFIEGSGNTSDGDILETQASLLDNQATPANVTGLSFSNGVVRSFIAQISVERGSDFEIFEINGIQKSADWDISVSSIGDITGINFIITSAGQIQYTSTSTGNSASVSFRADTTSI